MKIGLIVIVLLSIFNTKVRAQNTRLNEYNSIGWYNYFGTFKFSDKTSVHTEYQYRRDDMITIWQQSLLRVGLNYQLDPKVELRLGYAWIETFPYGDIPINIFGKDFSEHRLFQMITVRDQVSILEISHRFLSEQRWIGVYSNENLEREDNFLFSNRLRYMIRLEAPLKGRSIDSKIPYLALYDEIFAGYGKNVNENVFDQNRIALLIGYKFNHSFKTEAGYLSQIVQFGRELSGRNIFQYNQGIILNAIFNVDLR